MAVGMELNIDASVGELTELAFIHDLGIGVLFFDLVKGDSERLRRLL